MSDSASHSTERPDTRAARANQKQPANAGANRRALCLKPSVRTVPSRAAPG